MLCACFGVQSSINNIACEGVLRVTFLEYDFRYSWFGGWWNDRVCRI